MKIEEPLVDALLSDIESGGAKDALPLLGFTLERLYREYGGDGDLKLSEYEQLGRVKGSIEAAVERAFKGADADARIPKDREARLTLLRRGLIPWLAGIDPDTGAPRRRLARLSDIPAAARPLIDQLVEERLLSIDVSANTGETTIEPAHEALLRQWGLLKSWLDEDSGLLAVLAGIKSASRDWEANGKTTPWLTHSGGRLDAAKRLLERPDLAANLEAADREYILACQTFELKALLATRFGQRARSVLALLLFIIIAIPAFTSVYLPVAEIPVNWFVPLGISAAVGFFTGAFGITGTLLVTPLLVFLGIPPSVAVGTASAGILGSSISSTLENAHARNVDLWMITILSVGGAIGAWAGVELVRSLLHVGQFDTFLGASLVLLLTVSGLLTLVWRFGLVRFAFGDRRWTEPLSPSIRFQLKTSRLSVSMILLLTMGISGGLLGATTGVSGAIMVAAVMMYLFHVPSTVALSTSLVHSMPIAALTIMLHAAINFNVDLVLAATLLIGGIFGAQFGARAGEELGSGKLQFLLAGLLLAAAFRMVFDLAISPVDIYSVTTNRQAESSRAYPRAISNREAAPYLSPSAAPPNMELPESVQADLFVHRDPVGSIYTEIVIVGVVGNSRQTRPEDRRYDVAIVLEGMLTKVTVRRKSRVAGIWVNTVSIAFDSVPSYYTVITTRPLEEIADKTLLADNEIGFGQIRMRPSIEDADALDSSEYREAIVRLMRRNGLYAEETDGVRFDSGSIFRGAARLPVDADLGPLVARVYLFRESKLLSRYSSVIDPRSTGMLHLIRELASGAPLLYGLAIVLLAAIVAWIASAFAPGRLSEDFPSKAA